MVHSTYYNPWELGSGKIRHNNIQFLLRSGGRKSEVYQRELTRACISRLEGTQSNASKQENGRRSTIFFHIGAAPLEHANFPFVALNLLLYPIPLLCFFHFRHHCIFPSRQRGINYYVHEKRDIHAPIPFIEFQYKNALVFANYYLARIYSYKWKIGPSSNYKKYG